MNLPKQWINAPIAELVRFQGGGTPSKSDPSLWENGTIPWVSPKDMKTFRIVDSEDHITSQALGRLSLIPTGTVLMVVRSGILSRTLPLAITMREVTVNQDMRALLPEDGVLPEYVAYQLLAKEHEVLRECAKSGTTVASIEAPAFGRLQLSVAPTKEQVRVVAKLEELLSDLDAGVAELKAAQAKLGHYRQSLLKAAVDGSLTAEWRKKNKPKKSGAQLLESILVERRKRWEEKQLAKYREQGKTPPKGWEAAYPQPVTPDIKGLPGLPEGWVWATVDQVSESVRNGLSQKPSKDQIGYPILRINAVRPMSVNLEEVRYLDLTEDDAKGYVLDEGDLLATRYNGSVDLLGVFGVVRGASRHTLHPDKLIRIKPVLASGLANWIEACANVGQSRNFLLSRIKTTAGQTGISGEDLKKIPLPIAPWDEQKASTTLVAESISSMIEQTEHIDKLLRQASAQRKNILKAAFSGQLVPQDPNDEPASMLLERIRAERAKGGVKGAKRGRKAEKAA